MEINTTTSKTSGYFLPSENWFPESYPASHAWNAASITSSRMVMPTRIKTNNVGIIRKSNGILY